MSNTLSTVVPLIFAQGMQSLRSNSVLPRLVNNSFGNEVKQKGDTIQVPLPSAIVATNVVPGPTAPAPAGVGPTTALIPLSNWQEAAFTLTEKEVAQVISGVVPIQLSAAVESLATAVNLTIMNLYSNVYGYTGTAGTTPFASDITAATQARKVLTNQKAPTGHRRIVINPDAEANAMSLSTFYGALYTGDTGMIKEGNIGRKFGFDWAVDQQVQQHTAGSITTSLSAQASTSQPVGTTAIVCTTAATTGACALLAGDIVTFAGDSQTYALTASATQSAAATNVTLNITPGKVVALVGGEAVSVKATHVVNLAFHRDAFAFASRPLQSDILSKETDEAFQIADPVSGISMRLTYRKEYHQTRMAFDILWGVGLIRPQLACRIAG